MRTGTKRKNASTEQAEGLAEALSSLVLENVFNPYRDACPVHDRTDSPGIRKQNLEKYLASALESCPTTAWIGRDLGYRGGRRTGLPLTDEGHLEAFCSVFDTTVTKATCTPDVRERTAAEIWRVIAAIDEPPFLWNAFPFHPHEPGEPLNNRCHTRREFALCEDLFVAVLEAFNFEHIYVLGNDAARALERLGRSFSYVRHPSYGGQTEFRRQMDEAYALAPEGRLRAAN